MGVNLDLVERFWQGQIPPRDRWRPTHKSEELAARGIFSATARESAAKAGRAPCRAPRPFPARGA